MCPGGRPSSLLRRARESRPAETDPTTHVARQSGVPAGDAACLPLRVSPLGANSSPHHGQAADGRGSLNNAGARLSAPRAVGNPCVTLDPQKLNYRRPSARVSAQG